MIIREKKEIVTRLNSVKEKAAIKKNQKTANGNNMSVNTDLDKFTSGDFLPEKYKEDEIRLNNSKLSYLSPSFK